MNAVAQKRAPAVALGEIRQETPLADYTTWRVGGPARRFFRPASRQDLARFLAALPADEPLLWLGLGSNLLVRDGGFAGTVIFTQGGLDALKIQGDLLSAEAGACCAQVSRLAYRSGLTGVEFLAGIPGALGGALAMNAGAFGGEIWDSVQRVWTLDRTGEERARPRSDFEVGYRHVQGPPDEWFVAAELGLQRGDGGVGRARVRALLQRRNATQPIGRPSCGSVFRNPPGDHAARLIEAAGLKGERLGGAQVSDKHANFIINAGGARAADIEGLIRRVQARVLERSGVALQTEVRIVGIPEDQA